MCVTPCAAILYCSWNLSSIYSSWNIVLCHMGSHEVKVADSALYTVTRASGVIFLISPYFLCDISHITPRGSPRQIIVTHPCDKTLNTWQRAQIWGIPSAVWIASGIYPISRLLPCINYYIYSSWILILQQLGYI